jgi:hypothetical protein
MSGDATRLLDDTDLVDDDQKQNVNLRCSYKNQDNENDDMVIESEDENDYESVLNLSSSNLIQIASSIGSSAITTLILTNNRIKSIRGLQHFPRLQTLQLDRNDLPSIEDIPKLPNLKTLWLNNNKLSNMASILTTLKKQCPNLEYLSLLLNPVCPVLEQGTESRYTRYRHTVIYNLPKLQFLDTEAITLIEKKAASKKGRYLKVAKPDKLQLAQVEDEVEEENDDVSPYKNAAPAAFLGKGRVKYDGRESEGNRFISNQDL